MTEGAGRWDGKWILTNFQRSKGEWITRETVSLILGEMH